MQPKVRLLYSIIYRIFFSNFYTVVFNEDAFQVLDDNSDPGVVVPQDSE